jgi:hypothetical protein
MKDLLLRAWDKKYSRMFYLDGIIKYGSGWQDGGDPKLRFYQLHTAAGGFSLRAAEELELMIGSGFIDKNKRPIYEGDVVLHISDEKARKKVYNLVELKGAFSAVSEDGGGGIMFQNGQGWAPWIVAGNKFENPELFNVSKYERNSK